MSSSPRPERPSRTAGWPLRTKLVAAQVVLLAVVVLTRPSGLMGKKVAA